MSDITLPQLKQNEPPRSTRGKWRATVLIVVHILILAHIAHWLFKGETLAAIEPSESLYTLRDGVINLGVIFFAIALLTTALFGRFVCGWLCHFVAVQDLCSAILKKVGIRPKPFRSRLLLWAPLGLALYLFVWQPLAPRLFDSAPLIPEGGFHTELTTEGLWDTFPPIAIAIPFFLVCGALTIYLLGAKGFCTYACPYGGFFAPMDKLSPYRIVVDKDKCKGTGHCTAVCTSNVRVHQEVADYGKVVDPGCMKCTDCVSACPNGALSLKFTTPSLFTKTPKPERAPRSLSWGEDIAASITFVVVMVATFRAYGPSLFPLLFAAGLAACAAPVGVVLYNLPRKANMRFARFQLKRSGSWTPAGITTGLLGLILALLTLHTGVVNYHRWQIDASFNAVRFPTERFLAPTPPELTEEDRESLEHGVTTYERMASITPVYNERAHGRYAVMLLALGLYEEAALAFESLEERTKHDDLTAATRAQLLLRLDRLADADALTRERTQAHPAFWQTRDVRNRILVGTGRLTEAIDEATAATGAIEPSWRTREARARTWALLARLRAQARDGAGALEAVDAAADIDPRNVPIGELRAAFRLQIAGDPAGAIEEMSRLVEIEPDNAPLRLRFAQLGATVRNADVVREQAEAFVELQKESHDAKRAVAELYRAVGLNPPE